MLERELDTLLDAASLPVPNFLRESESLPVNLVNTLHIDNNEY